MYWSIIFIQWTSITYTLQFSIYQIIDIALLYIHTCTMLNIWHFTTETFLRAYIENSNTMKHCIFVSKKNDKSIDVSKSYYFFFKSK